MGEILTNSTFVTEINKIITKLGGTPSDISLTPDQANDIVNNSVFASKMDEVIQGYSGTPTVITLSDDEANDMVNKKVFSNKIDELSGVISHGGGESGISGYNVVSVDIDTSVLQQKGTITEEGTGLTLPVYSLNVSQIIGHISSGYGYHILFESIVSNVDWQVQYCFAGGQDEMAIVADFINLGVAGAIKAYHKTFNFSATYPTNLTFTVNLSDAAVDFLYVFGPITKITLYVRNI